MSRRSRKNNMSTSSSLPSVTLSNNLSDQQHPSIKSFFQVAILFFFHLMVLTIPFAFTWLNEELFEFNKMILTYGFSIIIGALWISRMIHEQRVLIKKTIFDIPIFLFLISQILSTIFSIHPYTSIFGYYTRFHGGLLSTISYIILFYGFVNNVEKKQIDKFLISIFAAAIGVCLYTIPEHFGYSPSCFLISGGKNFGVSCWIQDVKFRIFGTFGQPNWLAAYLITLMPIAIANLMAKAKNIYYLFFNTIFLFLSFATLIFTKSRSGLLGLVVGLSYFALSTLIFILIKNNRHQIKSIIIKGLIIFGSFLGLMAIFGTIVTPSLSELLQKNNRSISAPAVQDQTQVANRLDVGGTESGEIRKIVWEGALKVWQRYPILGSGVETFAYSYYLDRPVQHNTVSEWDFIYNKAHNEFLNFLATTGILGLLSYLNLFIFFTFYLIKFLSKNRESAKDYFFLNSLASGLIGLSVSNFFGFSTVMVSILMFLFFAILAIYHSDQNESEQTSAATSLNSSALISISLVWLVAIYLLFIIVNMWRADATYKIGKDLMQQNQLVEASKFLEKAIRQSPSEPTFYDALSTNYSQLANALLVSGQATLAGQVADRSVEISQKTIKLNPRHLNFYRNQARVYIYLSEIDPKYLNKALEALDNAQILAPTDAKIMYNRALIVQQQGDANLAKDLLIKTIEMKPNYDAARDKLAGIFEAEGQTDLAKEQYEFILKFITPENQIIKQKIQKLDQNN